MKAVFEQAIIENPDDLATWSAYADWLFDQGDSRGELMQVQLALEDERLSPEQRGFLRQREKELLAAHEREWLGPLSFMADSPWNPDDYPENNCFEYRFSRGLLGTLRIKFLTPMVVNALIQSTELRFVRTLQIADLLDDTMDPFDFDAVRSIFVSLARNIRFDNLRYFCLGREEEGTNLAEPGPFDALCWGAEELIGVMPRLETLDLSIPGVDLTALFRLQTLTHLREMRLYFNSDRHPLNELATNNAVSCLTRLLIHPGLSYSSSHDGITEESGALPLSVVREILDSQQLPNLTHLQLRRSTMGDEGCRAIVDSGILKRLKLLDLSYGCITDEGIRILVECPDLKNLDVLRLKQNGLSDAAIERLEEATSDTRIILEVDNQQAPEELTEHRYLFEDPWEG